jgi:leader peptidase (prepilin peptidase)/N-methyltransferase
VSSVDGTPLPVTPDLVWAAVAGVFGLAVGSFLNVVICRVPAGESVVSPPSKCPSCGSPIRHRHNVPVLGWLMLGGRCYDCDAPISKRYPLVEAATGVLFAAVTWRLLDMDLTWALAAYLYLAAAGVGLAMIDVDVKRLPDKIVLPSYAVVAVLLTFAALGEEDWWALARAAIGAAAMFAFYFAIVYAYPAGMGFGDVKLAGVLGALMGYLSWSALVVATFGAFLLGAIVGVALIVTRRGGRKTAIPFGPFMIAAALITLFAGGWIDNLYPRLMGIG